MYGRLSYVCLLMFGLLLTSPVYSQGNDTYTVKLKGGGTLKIKEANIDEGVAKSAKLGPGKQSNPKPASRGTPTMGRAEISEMARRYGLSQWLDVGPTSAFTTYWHGQEPTEVRLGIEFAALDVILKAAKADGLNTEAGNFYSAPQTILMLFQKRRADLDRIRLVEVPDLGNLSRAEAENQLMEGRLVPEARPQYAPGVSANRVIRDSQDPQARLSVQPGTRVSFGVNMQERPTQIAPKTDLEIAPKTDLAVSLEAQDKVMCSRGGDNIYRCSIRGTSSGLSVGGYGLLLWVKPVRPPSDTPGWYLQRPPTNGIDGVPSNGSWNGVAQLGNSQWPPHEGDLIDVAVSIADNDTINKLMAESGVVIRNQPVGVKVDAAQGLVVTLR